MIVCSRCQFENPEHHRYCQRCGNLLAPETDSDPIRTSTDDMGAFNLNSVDSGAENFVKQEEEGFSYREDVLTPQDNIAHLKNDEHTGVERLAIVSHVPDRFNQSDQMTISPNQVQYLDRANRYCVVTVFAIGLDSAPLEAWNGQEIVVIDSRPDEPPYLAQGENLTQEAGEEPSSSVLMDGEEKLSEVSVPLVDSVSSARIDGDDEGRLWGENSELVLPPIPLNSPLAEAADSTQSLKLPLVAIAPESLSASSMLWRLDVNAVNPTKDIQIIRTYVELQDQLYPSFPCLMDAWNDGGAVVVLENRSDLDLLKEVVAQPNVVPPQILHWCHEMAELWDVLSTYQCCQSLLKLDNLRLDEDHILCLRRLYFDDAPGQYTLKDLGQLWQVLFNPAADYQDKNRKDTNRQPLWPNALVDIYQDLASEAIVNLDTLRLRLETAADQIHHSALGAVSLETEETQEAQAYGELSIGDLPDSTIDEADMQAVSQTMDASKINDGMSISLAQRSASGWDDIQHSDLPSGITGLGDDPTVVLPMQLHTLSNAGFTNVGVQRDHNEDFFSMDTQVHTTDLPSGRVCKARGLYILCDGMGGHAAGEVASATAVESLQAYFQEHWTDELPDEDTIHQAIVEANQVIYDQNQSDSSEGSLRMGTTLVMLLVQDTKAVIAHVGDSRVYRFSRRQGLEQLTVDHEVGQREIARGVAPDVAYARPDAYQLTQALGPRDRALIRPDIQFIDINEDSLFILGSDGLTDNELIETYCESHVEQHISTSANLDEGVDNLIELANQVNGHDNITVLLVRVKLRPKLAMLHR